MKRIRWQLRLLGFLLFAAALWAGLNVAVDPFNAFGDVLFHWDSYTQTMNPRSSKTVYISRHFDEFDGYIVGSSSASSYRPETLARYIDADFYSLFHYGPDGDYDRQTIAWLLENDRDVKHIFYVLGLNDANSIGADETTLTYHPHWSVSGESALAYYGKYLFANPSYALDKLAAWRVDTVLPQKFDVFVAESGVYDKRVRDVEPIGGREEYLQAHAADFPAAESAAPLYQIDACVENVRQIRALCDEADVELTVVINPAYSEKLKEFTPESLDEFFRRLAAVTDYWNFAVSPLSGDPRYFYDSEHTRNAAADMVVAYMFGDAENSVYADLGVYCAQGEPAQTAAESAALAAKVPILLYHHLSETEPESATVLHPDTFARQMALLVENGYQAISLDDCIAFVESGTPLPEKPVVITFDDGYQSNYELAYPVLEQYGLKATIFVIGSSVGHTQYQDTEYSITPHFGRGEIAEMTASGLVTIASHTYNMHQWAPFESGDRVRGNILPLEDESEKEYIEALTLDTALQNWLFDDLGLAQSCALAYPMGQWSTLTNVVLRSCGYKLTVTTDGERVNTLVAGLPQSLFCLGRLTVAQNTTDEQLLAYLAQ